VFHFRHNSTDAARYTAMRLVLLANAGPTKFDWPLEPVVLGPDDTLAIAWTVDAWLSAVNPA